MQSFIRLFLGLAMVFGAMSAIDAQDPGNVHVVTYVEVRPSAKSEAATLLQGYRDATRKDEGNLHSEVVEHTSRPGQFVMLATWKEQKALDVHMAAARTKEFRDTLHALRNSPADDRIHNGLTLGATGATPTAGALYAITHVDVPPPRKDECIELLKKLAELSRKDEGSLRYDIVQQTNRPNHFTVVEVWKTPEAFEAHGAAAHVREFRDRLTPMSGALYDERLYKAVN